MLRITQLITKKQASRKNALNLQDITEHTTRNTGKRQGLERIARIQSTDLFTKAGRQIGAARQTPLATGEQEERNDKNLLYTYIKHKHKTQGL
jgi:hypothetical protein